MEVYGPSSRPACRPANILIRIDETTKEILRRRAERRGKTLEADLRETLERIAREKAETPDDTEPLVSITRPGVDLDETLEPARAPDR